MRPARLPSSLWRASILNRLHRNSLRSSTTGTLRAPHLDEDPNLPGRLFDHGSRSTRSKSTATNTNSSQTKPSLSLPNLRPDAVHTDLSSFLSHAKRVNLDPHSKVYVGTHYEYTVQWLLTTAYSFTLTRVAGTNDRGIDLLGYWTLPSLPSPVRVIVQCKVTSGSKSQPRVVRELEGSFAGAPQGWNDEARTLAVLVGTGEATKGIREAMRSSGVGVVWMSVLTEGAEGARLRQLLWNEKAREMALEGIDVVVRHDRDGGEELRLMWQGKLIPKGASRNGEVMRRIDEDYEDHESDSLPSSDSESR